MKIILLGYMGSGKTTVAKKLAELLHHTFLDLDELIEKNQNNSIKSIFSDKGELYFRKVEHQILTDSISKYDNFVLSMGGGTPCYAGNHLVLQQSDILSVYLKTSVESLYERLLSGQADRPLLADLEHNELKEFIAKHLFDRSFYYHQAKLIVTTDAKTTDQLAKEIVSLLI